MAWFVVVLFMQMNPDETNFYVFFKPQHETLEACAESITNPATIPKYITKLYSEYDGKLPPINRVLCIQEDKLKRVLEMKDGTSI